MDATLDHLFRTSLATNRDRIALGGDGSNATYGALAERVDRLSRHLAVAAGGQPRCGILLPNGAAFPVAWMGVLRSGRSALLLGPSSSPRELREQTSDAGVTTVITTESLRGLLPMETKALLVEASGELAGGFAVEPGDPPHGPPDSRAPDGDAEAAIIFTSGMRGRTRGAVLTQRNLIANLNGTIDAMECERDDVVVAALPFSHAFGLTVTLNAALAVGARVLPVPRFNPASVLELIEREQATFVAGVPGMFMALLAAAEKRGVPSHRLRVTLCGGAPMPLELGRRWEEVFGVPLRQGYGLTEAAPVCLFNRLDRPNRLGSLGVAFPGVDITIRTVIGGELPEGEVGELCVRGANVFPGFLDSGPDQPFHGEWLRTGDLASVEDGVVHFRGVMKKMFTRNGFNVYPEEIRRILTGDDRILDATVYARPDPLRENEIVLAVRVRRGAELSEREVREICRATLASYKQPTEIRFHH